MTYKECCTVVSRPVVSSPDDPILTNQVFVRNLDRTLSDQEIRNFFQKFGPVTSVQRGPKSKTTAFLTFAKRPDVHRVLTSSAEEMVCGTRQLYVEQRAAEQQQQHHQQLLQQRFLHGGKKTVIWPPKKKVAKLYRRLRQQNPQTNYSNEPLKEKRKSSASLKEQAWRIEEDIPSINAFPTEILDYIFSFLDMRQRILTELVCKRWRVIGKTLPWRWPKELHLLDNWNSNNDKSFLDLNVPLTDGILRGMLSRCGVCLKQIGLARNDYNSSWNAMPMMKAMNSIARYCPNLETVYFDGLPLTKQGLKILARGCSKLKRIYLNNNRGCGDEELLAFMKRCEDLTCLQISNDSQIQGMCFDSIGHNLHILSLHSCVSMKPLAMEKLMAQCDCLQELSMSYCDQLEDEETILKVFQHYKETLKVLQLHGYSNRINWCKGISLLTNLEELSLMFCNEVNDDLLVTLAKNCKKLKTLEVTNTDITDFGLSHLAALPFLKTLDISDTDITDRGLHQLAKAPCLKVLDVSYVPGIKGEGLEVLAEKGRLEKVKVIRSGMTSPDESCGFLARFCSDFRVLNARGSKGVSNRLVEAFRSSIQQGFLKRRIKLDVGLTSVTGDVETCERLEVYVDTPMPDRV